MISKGNVILKCLLSLALNKLFPIYQENEKVTFLEYVDIWTLIIGLIR